MTRGEIVSRIMARLNLSSTTAQTRIQNSVNERYRRVQTSCNLGRVRWGTVTATTTSGVNTITPSGIIKPVTVSLPVLNRVLGERTQDQMRTFDPINQWLGAPEIFAVTNFTATGVTMQLMPKPDAAYNLTLDGYLRGSDMALDADVPAFPEDFHDILVYGGLADEYPHLEKIDLAMVEEQNFSRRLGELRYFIQKSIYLHRMQNGQMFDAWWWWLYGSPWVR